MAAMITYIETIKSSLDSVAKVAGQLIYCTDSLETFYDTSDGSRIQMSDTIYLETEAEREALIAPLNGKIYFIRESGGIWSYDGEAWVSIKDTIAFEDAFKLDDIDALIIGTIFHDGKKRAPRTLTTAVYRQSDGKLLDDILTEIINGQINFKATTVEQSVTIDAASWTLDAENGYYVYQYHNEVIKADSVVTVNFDLDSLPYAEFFGVYSTVESFEGYVELYADEQPTADLICDIIIGH